MNIYEKLRNSGEIFSEAKILCYGNDYVMFDLYDWTYTASHGETDRFVEMERISVAERAQILRNFGIGATA